MVQFFSCFSAWSRLACAAWTWAFQIEALFFQLHLELVQRFLLRGEGSLVGPELGHRLVHLVAASCPR